MFTVLNRDAMNKRFNCTTSILAISLAASVCFAAKPLSKFNGDLSSAETSLEDAAISALRLSVKRSMRLEYGGCLFRKTTGDVTAFYFTEPATNHSPDDFAITCEIPSGAKLVGLYHTHPLGSVPGISTNDIDVAKKLNVTSFVAFIDQGIIMSYVPGKTRVRGRVADGDYVAKLR
jgi:hypothetical protein